MRADPSADAPATGAPGAPRPLVLLSLERCDARVPCAADVSLSGPSRTIIVEPLRTPAVLPERAPAAPEPAPPREPAREPAAPEREPQRAAR